MTQDDIPTHNVTIHPRAAADIEKCADYLEENASPEIALRFRNAIMEAVERIAAMPGAGSPRQVTNPRLSGLRMRIVPGFQSYLLFYITSKKEVEIVRLFHSAQDINTILETEE